MNQDKIALLKEMFRKYDFTSEERNLLAEMWEALKLADVINRKDEWEG